MLKKLLSPFGRLSRGGMWLWGVLIPAALGTGALFLDFNTDLRVGSASFSDTFNLFYLWPAWIALPIKRFHDLGLSGWLYAAMETSRSICIAIAVVAMFKEFPEDILFGFRFDSSLISNSIRNLIDGLPSVAIAPIAIGGAILSVAIFWMTLITPGNIGANRYGSDPLER